MKTFRHPTTKDLKTYANDDSLGIAAAKKLGYVEFTAKDLEDEAGLSVHYEQVTNPARAAEPPAVPVLDKPAPASGLPNAPTRDTSAPAQTQVAPIAREDVQPLTNEKAKDK